MLKTGVLLGVIALWSMSPQQGCQDLRKSLTHLSYYKTRDMRQTIVIDPQRGDILNPGVVAFRGPDSLSVPTIGRDVYVGDAPYDLASAKLVNPTPAAAAERSIALGDSLYHTVCWTCHGKTMVGDGPVAAQFMPPPDLLAQPTRDRTDGYLYMYMRHGGIVMPSYGNTLSSADAWALVNYIRSAQRTSPR